MREFNALRHYPQPKEPRYVGPSIRTIRNRIIASYRDGRYYDGERNNGYGGFQYDGRWKIVARSLCDDYVLDEKSSLLQLGCEKGFLLHDLHEHLPGMKVRGIEISDHAIAHSMSSIRHRITKGEFRKLSFRDREFDFVIAIGVVYTLNLPDAISCLREIQRVGREKSFITLGAYQNEQGARLLRYWTLLGTTILHVDEWREVLKEAGYTGDYQFITAEYLNLAERPV